MRSCEEYKGRWDTEEAAQAAIDHIIARTSLGDGKLKGMPRFVIPCGAHFHISAKKPRKRRSTWQPR
jgi:hypothetical protein